MRIINTGYSVGPILRAAIMEHIKRNGLTIVKNDDPIDWYKRTYCLHQNKPKQQHFISPTHQSTHIPVLVGQAG